MDEKEEKKTNPNFKIEKKSVNGYAQYENSIRMAMENIFNHPHLAMK